MTRWLLILGLPAMCLAALAAGYWSLQKYSDVPAFVPYNAVFKDDATSNTTVTADQLNLAFTDSKGKAVRLADYRGKSSVVLVVMRGFPGSVCPNCSAQTSRLIRNHAEFVKRGAEVLMVFPGKNGLTEFLQTGQAQADAGDVPFPVLLDPEFAAVDALGIRGFLARPSTYILDKQGQVRFAYVGDGPSDRPSIKAMLTQLDQINES